MSKKIQYAIYIRAPAIDPDSLEPRSELETPSIRPVRCIPFLHLSVRVHAIVSMPNAVSVAIRSVDTNGYALSLTGNLFTGKEGFLLVGDRSGSGSGGGYRGGVGGRGMGMGVGFDDGHCVFVSDDFLVD